MNLQKKKTVRLTGGALARLRKAVYKRAGGLCDSCGCWIPFSNGHLSHDKSKGSGGPDTVENTEWLCWQCHGGVHNEGQYTFCYKKRNKPRVNVKICERCPYFDECHKRKGGKVNDQRTTDDMV